MAVSDIELDIANIIKAIAFWEIKIENIRIQLSEDPNFDVNVAWQRLSKNQPTNRTVKIQDFIEFMQVSRIAVSEREAQILISSKCNSTQELDYQGFTKFVLPHTSKELQDLALRRRQQEQMYLKKVYRNEEQIKIASELGTSSILEQELTAYREIETLRENFAQQHGVTATEVYRTVDFNERGQIDFDCISDFMQKVQVQFNHEEYQAFISHTTVDGNDKLEYEELVNVIVPKEPYAYPAYRQQEFSPETAKKRIWQKALKHDLCMTQQVLDAQPSVPAASSTSFPVRRVYDPYNVQRPQFIYDSAYMQQLKEYDKVFYRPNKDLQFRFNADSPTRSVKYHDSFFDDYYKHLYERDQSEGFFNKFGKRYVYKDEIQQQNFAKKTAGDGKGFTGSIYNARKL